MDNHRPDLGHGPDRDSHFLAAPHAPRLKEHVGDLVAARIHDQPPDLPDLAVGRIDEQDRLPRAEHAGRGPPGRHR